MKNASEGEAMSDVKCDVPICDAPAYYRADCLNPRSRVPFSCYWCRGHARAMTGVHRCNDPGCNILEFELSPLAEADSL